MASGTSLLCLGPKVQQRKIQIFSFIRALNTKSTLLYLKVYNSTIQYSQYIFRNRLLLLKAFDRITISNSNNGKKLVLTALKIYMNELCSNKLVISELF